jgi:hypothetical protein
MSIQSDQTDFRYDLARACGLTVDATISLRTARQVRGLSESHRRKVAQAIYRLESATSIMFELGEQPWEAPPKWSSPPRKAKAEQLALM